MSGFSFGKFRARRASFLLTILTLSATALTVIATGNVFRRAAAEPEIVMKQGDLKVALEAPDASTGAEILPPRDSGKKHKLADYAGHRAAASFRLQRNDNKIKVRGPVYSEENQKILLGMIAATFPGFSIQDKTKIDTTAAHDDVWLSGVSFALRQLTLMQNGSAQLRDNLLTLHGVAGSAENYKQLQDALQQLPKGWKLGEDVSIRPPEAAYVWLAQLQTGSLNLSGHVPSLSARNALAAFAEHLFPTIRLEDAMQITQGAPKNWAEAALVSLRALQYLQSGSVSVSNQVVKIDGIGATENAAKQIDALNDSLPEGFSLENDVTTSSQRTNLGIGTVRTQADIAH